MALALALVAPQLRAEDDCGAMVETVIRFRGTVSSVEPLGAKAVILTPVDLDPRYVATVSVLEADDDGGLRRGESRNFGIHSPSDAFPSRPALGAPLDLELHSMACDGTFRRFFDLHERTPVSAEPFEGRLEVGSTYETAIRWDRDMGLLPRERLVGPHHHGVGIEWMNIEQFPALSPGRPAASLSFEVVERRTHYRGENQWVTIYGCRIVDVEE